MQNGPPRKARYGHMSHDTRYLSHNIRYGHMSRNARYGHMSRNARYDATAALLLHGMLRQKVLIKNKLSNVFVTHFINVAFTSC